MRDVRAGSRQEAVQHASYCPEVAPTKDDQLPRCELGLDEPLGFQRDAHCLNGSRDHECTAVEAGRGRLRMPAQAIRRKPIRPADGTDGRLD